MEKWMAEIVEVAFVFSQMATLPEDLPVLYHDISMLVGDPMYLNDWPLGIAAGPEHASLPPLGGVWTPNAAS